MSCDQFWLTKAQFSKIKPHLPTDTRGKARVLANTQISVRIMATCQEGQEFGLREFGTLGLAPLI